MYVTNWFLCDITRVWYVIYLLTLRKTTKEINTTMEVLFTLNINNGFLKKWSYD